MRPNRAAIALLVASAATVTCSDGGSGPPPTPVATSLSFQAQPANAVKDTALANAVRVAVLDQRGAVFASATVSISVALGANPGSATLTGPTTANAVAGVATFSGLSLDALGTGYTLVATSAGLPNATSAAFSVTLSLTDADGDTFSPNAGDCDDLVAAVNPGATDHPDPAFGDTNCDGIDGDESKAIFVATTGTDGPSCGTRAAPCQTSTTGLSRAGAQTKRDVYLAAGTYPGAITLVNGVSLYGQYSATWTRSVSNVTTFTGSDAVDAGSADPQALTVYGADLTLPTTIADVTIVGPNTTSRVDKEGRSSYALVLRNVAAGVVTIARATILAGNGASGADGANGVNAATLTATPGMRGFDGVAGDEPGGLACDDQTYVSGGENGFNTQIPFIVADGGNGGYGGRRDTYCHLIDFNHAATSGGLGEDARTTVAGPAGYIYGLKGHGGAGGSGPCNDLPGAGNPGAVRNGAAGVGGLGGGRLISDFWYGRTGLDGGNGINGTGGGGGGGAGGCDEGVDSYGASGGGGGAGGLRGLLGGGAGAGGGSFGIYLISASPTVSHVIITRGAGGAGGNGGVGGQGQSGGKGGNGGLGVGGPNGGKGGDGAHGGHGGGGGGGAGGIAAGIYRTSTASIPTVAVVIVLALGNAGQGGLGGLSAPNAVVAERDGNNGGDGADGELVLIGACASPTAC